MSSWADTRRADRIAAREQDRLDAAAAADRQTREREQTAAMARADRTESRRARDRRLEQSRARRAARLGWLAGHAVDLLIYPLAAVSAVMAVPAMAAYGIDVYGNATGAVLPVLSELGMWAFALAVMVSRRRSPDRPTTALTAGIAVFAAVGFGLNFAHGLTSGGLLTGVVMAVVSVAGVIAHQLVTAGPRRARGDRAARRLDRLARRRVHRARRAAARTAVVNLAADGTATLLYAPGRYQPHRRRLRPATVPGLPPVDDWDRALADLTGHGPISSDPIRLIDPADPIRLTDQHESDGPPTGGGVALADPPPIPPGAPSPTAKPQRRPQRLTAGQARTAARRLARRHGKPVTADQLRQALHIAPKAARELRDQINAELYPPA